MQHSLRKSEGKTKVKYMLAKQNKCMKLAKKSQILSVVFKCLPKHKKIDVWSVEDAHACACTENKIKSMAQELKKNTNRQRVLQNDIDTADART